MIKAAATPVLDKPIHPIGLSHNAMPNITFAMIKSDAFTNGVVLNILSAIRRANFIVLHSLRDDVLSDEQIKTFYHEHLDKPYFDTLYASVSGYVMPLILEAPPSPAPAYSLFRSVIGATDARIAASRTIRAQFGGHVFDPTAPLAKNAIHGSDSLDNALREIGIIFGSQFDQIHSHYHGDFYLDEFSRSQPTQADG